MELTIAAAIAIGLNMFLFIPAFFFKTDKLTDFSYTLSFFLVGLALYLLSTQTTLHLLLLAMITAWALRLGGYLFIRIHKIQKDKRFDGKRESFLWFFRFWFIQGVSVFVILIPSAYFFATEAPIINEVGIVGLIIWLFGLLVEGIADYQKYTFINDENNKEKWIDTGLWKYSQHPNYFGEITVWTGVYLFTCASLMGTQLLYGLASPLFIITLLLFISGIPILDKSANERWGTDPAYQAYKRRTSKLILWCNKK